VGEPGAAVPIVIRNFSRDFLERKIARVARAVGIKNRIQARLPPAGVDVAGEMFSADRNADAVVLPGEGHPVGRGIGRGEGCGEARGNRDQQQEEARRETLEAGLAHATGAQNDLGNEEFLVE
jgi:hypothetical protein